MDSVLQVDNFRKTFHVGFFRKRVEAARGISFEVRKGEIFGLLGPNGAGKTTTIKTILRLIRQSEGTIRLFGESEPSAQTLRKIGYLPENPYIYQYLRAEEFLDLCARLTGVASGQRRERITAMIARVGLAHAVDRPIGKFSKGMMQRVGLAQALLHSPDLLILDEPMSGLDPVGRREVRELILEQRTQGKTVLFTSHILSDVERLCDRVAIVQRGVVTAYGSIQELLRDTTQKFELIVARATPEIEALLESRAVVRPLERGLRVEVDGAQALREILRWIVEHDLQIMSLNPHRESLENFFLNEPEAVPS